MKKLLKIVIKSYLSIFTTKLLDYYLVFRFIDKSHMLCYVWILLALRMYFFQLLVNGFKISF